MKNPRFIVTKVTAVEERSESLKTDDKEIINLCADASPVYRNENRSGRSSPMPMNRSPLFFTLRDFESVMAHSGISDRSMNEQYDSIKTEDTSGPTSVSSFVENFLADEEEDDDEEQVCFRVTTTNVPFEKSVGGWSVSIDGPDFVGNCGGTENFMFEDYIDRSRRVNARPTFLFDDDTFDNFGRDDAAGMNRRSATKVRFVIESPSSSTPDADFDDTCDDLGNIESIIVEDESVDDSRRTSVVITEIIENNQTTALNDNTEKSPISDEFGEIPFSSLLDSELNTDDNLVSHKNINTNSDSSTIESNREEAADNAERNVELASMELENPKKHTPRNSPSPRFKQRENFECRKMPDIDDELLAPALPITYDPREEGFVRKDDLSRFESDGRKMAREAFVTGNFSAVSCENRNLDVAMHDDSSEDEVTVQKPRTAEKKKIFIDSALRDFIDDDGDMDWNDLSDEEAEEKKDDSNVASGSSLSSANDRRVEEPGAGFSDVLNRDTCDHDEASLDKYPGSQPSPTSDKESNEKKFANKEDLKDGPALAAASSGHCLINTSGLSTENKDDMNWLPVSVRRNSFLENMLVDDETLRGSEGNAPCSIIATHPKQPFTRASTPTTDAKIPREIADETGTSLFRDVNKSSDVAAAIVRRGSNESSQKQLRNETGVRIVGASPAADRDRTASGVEKEKRSTGEAKSDVLSELLCNFGAIKLKPLEPQKRDTYLPEFYDKAAIERKIGSEKVAEMEIAARIKTENVLGVVSSSDKETKTNGAAVESPDPSSTESSVRTAKTTTTTTTTVKTSLTSHANGGREKTDDHTIDEKGVKFIPRWTMNNEDKLFRNEDNAESINLDASLKIVTDNDSAISVDKCAIDRKINPLIRRNNNDNNAMTPVDISNDQKSCDTDVTIAPGSVRSFVELYEIRGDQTSKHSKSNYSLPVAKKLTNARFCKGLRNEDDGDDDESEVFGDENVGKSKVAKGFDKEEKKRSRSEINVRGSCVDLFDTSGEDAGHNVIVRNVVAQNGDTSEERNGFSSTNDSSHVQQQQQQTSGKVPVAAKRRSQDSCLKISAELSPRTEAKKTVTFNSDCEVIKTRNNAPDQLPFVEPTNGDGGPIVKTKKRAPGKPAATGEMDKRDRATESIVEFNQGINPTAAELMKQQDRANHTPTPRSEVNSHRTQIRPGLQDDEDGTIKTGIASSVPTSDVPHLQQPYVFYCML